MTTYVMKSSDSMTVRSIKQFSQDILSAIESHDEIIFDLTSTTEMDLSFIQAIEAARLSCADKGGTLRLSQPAAEALTDLLGRAGFLEGAESADLDFWFHGRTPQ